MLMDWRAGIAPLITESVAVRVAQRRNSAHDLTRAFQHLVRKCTLQDVDQR